MPNGPCSIPDCDHVGRLQRSWCEMHYKRWQRHGHPLTLLVGHRRDFFEASLLIETDLCIDWPPDAARNGSGYGMITVDGEHIGVHVLACRRAHGERPFLGAQVRHLCGRGPQGCFNPRHLRWGTRKENGEDRTRHRLGIPLPDEW